MTPLHRTMNNASCADCGRIVAFRTNDPTEIAECRGCGTWVKRNEGQPGLAVRISGEGQSISTAQITSAEARKLALERSLAEETASPPALESPFMEENAEPVSDFSHETVQGARSIGVMSAADVYQAIHELKDAVETLQKGQEVLLERTLPVPAMPVPDSERYSESGEQSLMPQQPRKEVPTGFFTTPFSSLRIPVIPANLDDLKVERSMSEHEVAVAPIPAAERSDRNQLIYEDLPEAPEPVEETFVPQEEETPEEEAVVEVPEFVELTALPEPEPETPELEELEEEDEEEKESNPFDSPFFTEESFSAEHPPPLAEAQKQPSGLTEIPSPFQAESLSLSDQIRAAKGEQGSEPLLEQKPSGTLGKRKKPTTGAIIAIIAIVLFLLALLGGLSWLISKKAAPTFFGFGNSEVAAESSSPETVEPPLLALPPYGVAVPENDKRVKAATSVARKFCDTKSVAEAIPLALPIDRALLDNFYEPMVGPTIELYQARQLSEDRVEVDFLVKDYGRPEKLLPVVKIGKGPFLVDWKTYAECEELTLLSLTQGTLILNGEEVEGGVIRSWMEHGDTESEDFPISNFQGFLLHNITEEAMAVAYARKGSPALIQLVKALETTEILYRGQPAIRTILRVKRITPGDPASDSPTRLEIVEVMATDWRADTEEEPTSGTSTESSDAEAPDQSALPSVDGSAN